MTESMWVNQHQKINETNEIFTPELMAIKLMNQGVQAPNTSLQQPFLYTGQSTLPLLCLLLILFGFTTSGFPLADAEFGICL
jgi:hypothetical protein